MGINKLIRLKIWARLLLITVAFGSLVAITARNLAGIAVLTQENAGYMQGTRAQYRVVGFPVASLRGVLSYGRHPSASSGRHLIVVSASGPQSTQALTGWQELVRRVDWRPEDRLTWITTLAPNLRENSAAVTLASKSRSFVIQRIDDYETFQATTGISRWPMTVMRDENLLVHALHVGVPARETLDQFKQAWDTGQLERGSRPPYIVPSGSEEKISAVPPAPKEDCITYDPKSLSVSDFGAEGWAVAQGGLRLVTLDTQEDATLALAIARAAGRLCYIGRSVETSENYHVQYWDTPGLTKQIELPMGVSEDCGSYDPMQLTVRPSDHGDWSVSSGKALLVVLHSKVAAEQALAIAQKHARLCFIGRANTRPLRRDYIVQYWK